MITNAAPRARIVRVKIEEGRTGLFYATSPDLKGLLVAEPTMDALEAAVPQAIADLYAVAGVQGHAVDLDPAVGELDPVTPVAAAEEVVASLPAGTARLEVVPNAGHFTWLDAPDRVFATYRRFLGEVSAHPLLPRIE